MKVLNQKDELQTIRVIPRSYPSSLTLTLRDDQTNDVVTYAAGFSIDNDYLVIDNIYSLREFHFYDLSVLDQDGDVIYKDKIFCTNEPIADFSVNASTETWLEANVEWQSYAQDWDGTEYISEPTYDNDYIIL
jgi:hypothetical protein